MEQFMRQLLSDSPTFKPRLFQIPMSEESTNSHKSDSPPATSPAECTSPKPLRIGFQQPKPQHSYIGLIAMAILSVPEKKMVLAEVYEWIMTEYPYFRTRGAGWRNSIRHNLSLNDCFVKAGRASNGKGHYWAVHPACVRDFERGDFRRRRAQRKVRRHMGLSVDEDDSTDDEMPRVETPFFGTFVLNSLIPPVQVANRVKSFTIEEILGHS